MYVNLARTNSTTTIPTVLGRGVIALRMVGSNKIRPLRMWACKH